MSRGSENYCMNIVVGLNHKTAPIELRERFAFSMKEVETALKDWSASDSARELVILSTCNRVEVYTYGVSASVVAEWLCMQKNLLLDDELRSHMYIFSDLEAIEHLMRVACGLDSLVLGEPEIFGQVKAAFSLACLHKTIGSHFSRLFRQTFHVAKQIRSATKIGACPVSVASTAVQYAGQWVENKIQCPRILVIGTGNVGQVFAKRAQSLTSPPMLIMSRHFSNAEQVAKEVEGVAVDFSELSEYIHVADIIVTATSSKDVIITPELVMSINKPTLFIDLAVPRNISQDIVRNSHIDLCQLDQLKTVIQHHAHMRSHAALQAEKIIQEHAREFLLSLRRVTSDEIICGYRASMEAHSDAELEKVLKNGLVTEDMAFVLQSFSRNLLNKIMHLPSIQLQQASVEGRDDVLKLASEIFGIHGNKRQ